MRGFITTIIFTTAKFLTPQKKARTITSGLHQVSQSTEITPLKV
jgi:hypothetical protein